MRLISGLLAPGMIIKYSLIFLKSMFGFICSLFSVQNSICQSRKLSQRVRILTFIFATENVTIKLV